MFTIGHSSLLRLSCLKIRNPVCQAVYLPIQSRGIRYDEYLEMEKWQHLPKLIEFEKSEGSYQKAKGKIYSKYPFKFTIEKGKKYAWCSCGFSHTQPFCDGAHKKPWVISGLKPVKFMADETKEVWFCNCKQTSNKPYCDKSCESEEVKDARTA